MQGVLLRKYNEAATINFTLYQPDGVDLEPAATFAAGDLKIMKDEGAEANTANLPTDEGRGYSLVLTATEMQAARIVVYIVDQTTTKVWLDTAIVIETYGHANAQHAFDLDTASQTVNVGWVEGSDATDQMRDACKAALEAFDLDHLIEVSSGVENPTAGTYLDLIMNASAPGGFNRSTDSLEAAAENLATLLTRLTAARASNLDNLDQAVSSRSSHSAADVADSVWDEATTGHVTAGTFGQQCKTDIDQLVANMTTALNRIGAFSGSSDNDILGFLRALMRKDGGITTPTDVGGSYDHTTDSQEAIRDNQGGGGSGETQLHSGTAQAGGASTITLDTGASSVDDYYNYAIIGLTGGTGAGQSRIITDYVGSTRVATVNGGWATQPDNTTTFVVLPLGQLPGASAPTAGEVADAVWDEAIADHQSSGSTGEELHVAKAMVANKRVHTASTGVDVVKDNDGSSTLRTMTPTDDDNDTITITPS